MRRVRGKLLLGVSLLGALGGVAVFIVGGGGGREEVALAVGSFREGWELAHRRAGFSGRPLVMVFAKPQRGLEQVESEILADPRIQEAAALFSAALIHPDEIPADAQFRPPEEDLPIVHARDVHGRCLGILSGAEVTSANVRELLARLGEVPLSSWPRSPLYESLLESAEALDAIIARGDYDEARFVIDELVALEGGNEAAERAQARRDLLPR